METINEYTQQGIDFLNATGTTMTVKFLKHGKHFDDDKDDRDIYQIELKRGSRVYKFNFGQSINHSGKYIVWINKYQGTKKSYNSLPDAKKDNFREKIIENPNLAEPNAYDVLACLTDNDPGTFENFCGDFGYDIDSRKAEKVYKAVVNEWQNVAMLFTDAEIEQLQEIS